MSDTTIRLKIKIEGDDSLKDVEVSAEQLAQAFVDVKDKVHELNEKLLNVNQISQAFEQMGAAVQGLQSVMNDLTDAYAVQAAAEARLEQMMRNTMDATDAEIKSIKDLAAEQQKLGVIGDEVILSGAQELATYMQKKDSLEALIPVMDDMIAQQYGYNATAESAVSVAQMLGKVFAGETGALKRLGYTFDEAQEAVLKYGSEEEKVAMLTEVVGQIVDGTNAKLASMPYGKVVQFRNGIGDLKEGLGKMVAPAMNAVDGIAKVSIAAAGIGKGVATVKAAAAAFKAMTAGLRTATAAQHGLNTAMKANVFIAVASAVAALVAIIVRLARANKDASQDTKELTDTEKAFQQAAGDAKGAIIAEADELMMLISTNNDTTEAVAKLNEKYGDAFGYYSTAAQWYDVLKNKSESYCRQLGYEAKAKQISVEVGNKITERDRKQEDLEELKSQLPDFYQIQTEVAQQAEPLVIDGIEVPARVFVSVELSPEQKVIAQQARELVGEVASLDNEINGMLSELRDTQGKAAQAVDELKGTVNDTTQAVAWQTMSYEALGKAIQEQTKKVKESIAANDGLAEAEAATLNAMQLRYDQIGKQFDRLTGKVKNIGNEIRRIHQETIPTLAPIGTPPSIDTAGSTYNQPQPLKDLFNFNNLGDFNQRLAELEQARLSASQNQLPLIDAQIALVKQLKDEFEGVNQTVAQMPSFADAWSGIKGIGNSIRDITNALTESEDAWTTITGLVDGFISLFQGFQQVVEIINAVSAATNAMAATKSAASTQVAAANSLEATSNTAVAATGAASAMANIPWVGPALAIAAVGAVLASLMSLPKFANGGLVYGPTLGLMGEYGGASSNPEVIAPLSRLRSILGADQGGRTQVEFHIKGRELVGIMNKQNNIYSREK